MNLYSYLSGLWLSRRLRLFLRFHLKLKARLTAQLEVLDECKIGSVNKKHPRILVPLIESNHYQFYQILALAKALQVRGADILILLCDSRLKGCELKSVRGPSFDPCLTCRFNRRQIVPLFGLNTKTISDFLSESNRSEIESLAQSLSKEYPSEYYFEGINIVPMTNDSVTRYFYGNVSTNQRIVEKIRMQHLDTALTGIHVAKNIEGAWRPDIVLGNMNVYTTWEPYSKYFLKHDIKYNTISLNPLNYSCITFNLLEIYKDTDRFVNWKNRRSSNFLIEGEKIALATFIQERYSGMSQIFQDSKVFEGAGDLNDILTIDQNKTNVFLFSNIFWDVGISETGFLYDDVISWVIDSISIVAGSEQIHLYIKPHPAEVYDSSSSLKGIREFISDTYPVLPPNVTIIHPEYKIKTYDLFPFIDFAILYNGNLGLEMLLKGIPIVLTGLAPYKFLGSVTKPNARLHYQKILLGKCEINKIDPLEVELFSYFYFIKIFIPWTLTKRAFADDFKGFTFDSLDNLLPGEDKYLDHICNCILNPKHTVIESW